MNYLILSQKSEKIWFLRTQGGLILARGQSILEKDQKRANVPNENFGARKCYLGPNFWNLAPKRANLATLLCTSLDSVASARTIFSNILWHAAKI